ncbi:PleD family two-component system response regulator [Orientia tsutsugamushi]|uniref:diguanylate cyclase n=1 Tax=Orientia tsutsugamushi (strain Boryong) TaxID=357244 RepID=A5CCH1_ORITB|nr:PleD family two-component system response regulator [Orientia tsutsugamushi]CAM79396.1 PleD-like response regulator, receivor domain/GGDEF domain [Orientia tsutsugamushi str. Boryong]
MTAAILVVDDLEYNRKLLETKLLTEYYTVYTAANGQEAIKILEAIKIDVVLLDIVMPGMDGFELCKAIKSNQDTAHIPVIIITALSDIEDKVKGLECGADEFLTKPIEDISLFARVKSLVRMKAVSNQIKLRSITYNQINNNDSEFLNANKVGTTLGFKQSNDFSNSTILIIDDDAIWFNRISEIITCLTKKVELFECINYTDNKNKLLTDLEKIATSLVPDLLIINNQIILEDPLRVYAILRSKDELKQSAFILLTEDSLENRDHDDISTDKLLKGLEMGINDFFPYSIDNNELLARIKTQLRRKQYQDQLKQDLDNRLNLAAKDGLTNIFNRRYFDSHINQLINDAKDSNKSLFLIMIDFDHFKMVNDIYGHQVGDEVLKASVKIIETNIRVTDLIARYGGEEFIITIYDDDIDQQKAIALANRIKIKIETHNFIISNLKLQLKQTISIGITEYDPPEDANALISRTDKALYNAKHYGRNQVWALFR